MGRGVHAAAAMAQMRSAVRAFVAVDPGPASVLTRLDRLFEQYDIDQLVTMMYAVADPARDELHVANAGHPPPVAAPGRRQPGDPAGARRRAPRCRWHGAGQPRRAVPARATRCWRSPTA